MGSHGVTHLVQRRTAMTKIPNVPLPFLASRQPTPGGDPVLAIERVQARWHFQEQLRRQKQKSWVSQAKQRT